MKPTTPQGKRESAPDISPEQAACARAVGAWLQHLVRALKTCRLYAAANPTVVRFRQDLWGSLQKLVSEHGSFTLRIDSENIECEETNVYSSRSRDDNLALAFHRDGVRGITVDADIEPRELDALLDAILEVTSPNREKEPGTVENDLVTLLWEAHLKHVDIDYVPAEGDLTTAGEGETVPWPTAAPGAEEAEAASTETETQASEDAASRSDDWSVGLATAEIEATFESLERAAAESLARFRDEYTAERHAPIARVSLDLARAYMASGGRPDDNVDLTRFLPRVLRQSLVQGNWREATDGLTILANCPPSDWSVASTAQELLQPISISSMRDRLEDQEAAEIESFVGFAESLGEATIDLLNLVLAEIQNPRHQRQIAEAIARLCEDQPERLAPYLSDPRWFAVRNAVQILGQIGGEQVVGLLRSAAKHHEPRVRLEVVAALRRVPIAHSRPVLLNMLEGADSRQFCALLSQLSEGRDPGTARIMMDLMKSNDFDKRTPDEQRAIYSTLAAVGGDEVLADLESELHKGNWFSRQQESHRQAVARCLARIGTERAKAILTRGASSRRGPVRKACELALGSMHDRG